MSNIKDWLTTIFSIITVLATAVNAYLQTIPVDGAIDWFQLTIGIVAAMVAFFTGKTGNGKTKLKPASN